MTPDEVRAFQDGRNGGAKPIDYYGKPLRVDGQLGPKTQWAIDIAKLPVWRQEVVRFLVKLHGWQEQGVNQGELIERAMAVCNLDNDADGSGPSDDGRAWCAALQCLALWQHSPFTFKPDASVKRLVESLHPVEPDRVLPGDLAYAIHPSGLGHVGGVIAIGGGWTASLDGNLNNRVQAVRYPTSNRLYVSVEPQLVCPPVPMELPIYTGGSTR